MQTDSVHYRLVYDAARAGYTDWSFPAVGLILLTVFLLGIVREKRQTDGGRRLGTLYATVAFITVWILVSLAATYGTYASIRSALNSGRFVTVEGTVTNFVPSDSGDHREEQWDVDTDGAVHHYHYVPSRLTPGFRRTQGHGGPIRAGLRVRIADVNGWIARLEIAP